MFCSSGHGMNPWLPQFLIHILSRIDFVKQNKHEIKCHQNTMVSTVCVCTIQLQLREIWNQSIKVTITVVG